MQDRAYFSIYFVALLAAALFQVQCKPIEFHQANAFGKASSAPLNVYSDSYYLDGFYTLNVSVGTPRTGIEQKFSETFEDLVRNLQIFGQNSKYF